MLFEDSVSRDDDLLLQAIRHPIKLDLKRQLFRKFEACIDGMLSKDSKDFKYIFSKNSLIQERPFHRDFPKKASNLDTEELYSDMNNDFVVRWIPRDYAKIVFPALYFSDMVDELKRQRRGKTVPVEFMGGQVPTTAEKNTCKELGGTAYWIRKGDFFCSCQNIDVEGTKDMYGPKFFRSYNEWLKWDGKMRGLEESARVEGDDDELRRITRCKQ